MIVLPKLNIRVARDRGTRIECACGVAVYEAWGDVSRWIVNHRTIVHRTAGGPTVHVRPAGMPSVTA